MEVGKDVAGKGDVQDGNHITIKCLGNGNGNNETDSKHMDEGDALGNRRPNYGGDIIARMPTERFASHYKMDHPFRGIALIFNHEHFTVPNLKRRAGTEQDRNNLEQVLKALGFDVRVYQDLKHDDLFGQIRLVAEHDHSDYDCLCISVLTHGDEGILYAKDTQYKTESLWNKFTGDRCPTLAGKPKLFFFQACQGDKLDGGVILSSRTETDGHNVHYHPIPREADFLLVYSTVKGYYSWRNTTRGSWFIQALCEELKTRAFEVDLLTIMTYVSQRVAFDYESNVPDQPIMHKQKQIPCVMSMLTRLIQFNRIGSETNAIVQKDKKSKSKFSGFFHSGGKS